MIGGIGLELTWFQSILLGFLSGLAEILPVSAEAHRLVALKLFGNGAAMSPLTELFLHMGTLMGLYYCCHGHIVRIMRAQRLAKVPKHRRKRPLDVKSLLDFKLLLTTLIPSAAAFFFYDKTSSIAGKLYLVAFFLLLNGVILYVPQYLPGSNKDSRTMSPVDGLLIGLGGAISTIPGISCIGAGVSIATVCGADKTFALSISLLMAVPVTIGYIAMDILTIFAAKITLSFGLIFSCLLIGAAAFAGVFCGIKFLRKIIANFPMSIFGFYCWGLALFTFILYLTAA